MRTSPPADRLSVTLFGKTRRRVFDWLFTHPGESFYLRQLARITGSSPGALERELAKLTAAGILSRSLKGRATFYQADPGCPIYSELGSIIRKTSGVAGEIRRALESLASKLDFVILHGSAASGALRSASDVDLVTVGAAKFPDVVEALRPAQQRLGREVNPIVYTAGEFTRRIRSGDHFVTTLLQEPRTFIRGDADELERLVPKRLARSSPNVSGRNRRSPGRRRARPRR
ncbi:MAG TPA: nucleotidyltransferase domain-containing protein [Thermoanaerobaculia bacterium]